MTANYTFTLYCSGKKGSGTAQETLIQLTFLFQKSSIIFGGKSSFLKKTSIVVRQCQRRYEGRIFRIDSRGSSEYDDITFARDM